MKIHLLIEYQILFINNIRQIQMINIIFNLMFLSHHLFDCHFVILMFILQQAQNVFIDLFSFVPIRNNIRV